jgi:hypothetical protein
MLDTNNLPQSQKTVWRKAMYALTEARDLLCCCNSPLGSVETQAKVCKCFDDLVSKLKSLK